MLDNLSICIVELSSEKKTTLSEELFVRTAVCIGHLCEVKSSSKLNVHTYFTGGIDEAHAKNITVYSSLVVLGYS